MAADILVLAGPMWLGDNSSVTKHVIERLYSCSGLLNSEGQYAYYCRVGGCLITGNEDGVQHRAMNFTNRNTTFMTWNLMRLAAMLKRAEGFPAYGNQRSEWDAGCRLDAPNPDYR
ncbi:hypothetical protein GCM10022403_085430 [Streptomyces coacervatus]|uniref:Flavodoxin family protein n=1 Tax=Streptomyces coacervatus TaxID=647381 RepID=A0ABP7JBH9_9ACTN